jgi:hypothetical protein
MEIVKKNIFSIILGVIAIAAVVANFYPMSGKYEELKNTAQARAQVDQDLKSLLNKPRNLPVMTEGGQPQPLGHFPTQKIIDAGKKATEDIAKGSQALLDNVVKLNTHEPLVARSLPGVLGDPVPAGEFARRYVQLTGMVNPDTRKASIAGQYRLGIPPSEQEITRASELKRQEVTNDTKRIDAQGNIVNQQEIDANVASVLNGFADQLRADVAKNSMVYVNPDAITIAPNVGVVGTPPDPTVIWWAQVGLWVQDDLLKAVQEINTEARSDGSKPTNVTEAPIKRILKITVPPAFVGVTPMQPGQNAQPDPNAPSAPVADPNAAVTKNTAASPTGRVNNGLFDVMQYDVDMDVEADQVPIILERLSRGRLIDVIQVTSITALDTAPLAQAYGYFYGNKPVVNLRFRCEELFMRKWTGPLMPPPVRKQLGVPEPTPEAPKPA